LKVISKVGGNDPKKQKGQAKVKTPTLYADNKYRAASLRVRFWVAALPLSSHRPESVAAKSFIFATWDLQHLRDHARWYTAATRLAAIKARNEGLGRSFAFQAPDGQLRARAKGCQRVRTDLQYC